MSDWQPIETAPKNPSGVGVGPWILIWSDWDHGVYQVRWETHGERGNWKAKGVTDGPRTSKLNARYWMPLPDSPLKSTPNQLRAS